MKLSDRNVQLDLKADGVHTRSYPWPFLYAVDPEVGIVLNVQPEPDARSKGPVKPKARGKGTPGGSTPPVAR